MKTILLADDEPSLRTLVRTTLEDPLMRVVEATNGRSALECVRHERPDLLLIDWMMPEMTGIEVIRALRQDPATAGLPVVMLTARGQVQDRELALALGVRHYLLKPFSPLELLDKVNELLAEADAAVGGSAQEPPRPVEPVEGDGQLERYARDLKRTVDLERKRARELAEANARLESLNRLKSDFLSFISHELRTPLNAMSMVDLFDPGASAEEQAQTIEAIRSGYERLQAFVQKGLEYFNWLAIERVDPAADVDLAALLRSTVARSSGASGALARVELKLPSGSCVVRGAAEKLGSVLAILLDNALKFSGPGELVRVELSRAGDKARVRVVDHGSGFPTNLARELFEPFTIADVRHHSAGSGLSLALASAILGAHGGRVTASSEGPGRGATFVVELPLAGGGACA